MGKVKYAYDLSNSEKRISTINNYGHYVLRIICCHACY